MYGAYRLSDINRTLNDILRDQDSDSESSQLLIRNPIVSISSYEILIFPNICY